MRSPARLSSPTADGSWGTAAPSCRDAQGLYKGVLVQLSSLEEKVPVSSVSYQLALLAQLPCQAF